MTERPLAREAALTERTVPGLHDAAIACVRDRLAPSLKAVDLGTGSGAFAARLESLGCDVIACDADPGPYAARSPFRRIDLNRHDFASDLGQATYDLVTAIEVIEHLEAPVRFLSQVRTLLRPTGYALVTTPNVDSLPARVKFLVKGTVRMFDARGDPTHISPIFWDLLLRQYLPRGGLRVVAHVLHPPDRFLAGRPAYRKGLAALAPLLRVTKLAGDNHILVLAPRYEQ